MRGNWGATDLGLAFYQAAPKNEGSWLSLFGLFAMGFVFSAIAGAIGYGIGAFLTWIVAKSVSLFDGPVSDNALSLIAWMEFTIPSLLGATGAGLGLIHVVQTKAKSTGATYLKNATKVNWKHFGLGVIVYCVIEIPISLVGMEVAARIWPESALFGEELEGLSDWSLLNPPTLLYFAYLLLLAPVVWVQTGAEEIAFRGVWFQQLGAEGVNWVVGALAISAVFALFHIGSDWIVIVVIGMGAMAWAYAAIRFGNVSYGWGAHFTNNFYLFALLPLVPINIDEIPELVLNQGPDLSTPDGPALGAAFVLIYFLTLVAHVVTVRWLTRKADRPQISVPEVQT